MWVLVVYRSRLWRRLSENTPSGLVVLFSLPSPPSKTCGAPSKNMTSLVLELFIAVRNTLSLFLRKLSNSPFITSHRMLLNDGRMKQKKMKRNELTADYHVLDMSELRYDTTPRV